MEELHEAAMAYYTNASTEQKNLVKQFFRSMDDDCSGRVSLQQFTDFFCGTHGLAQVSLSLQYFRGLDRNGDGYLDFFEVLTFYYTRKRGGMVICDICSKLLCGLHFTCVECFETPSSDTFDLCIKCYKEMKFSHQHGVFLDSYALLRSKRNNPVSLSEVFRVLEIGYTVGNVAAVACTIM